MANNVAAAVSAWCGTIEHDGSQIQQARVLFVGPHDRKGMASSFEKNGFAVLHSVTASEALAQLQSHPVTLVITGGRGSKRAGRAILQGLRTDARRHVPVVWLGAADDDEEALLRQGVSLFLRAPYPVDQLLSAAMFAL